MWEQALTNIVHSVKTAYGESTGSYASTPDSPIIGPGQGSRGGPTACTMVTSTLLKGMDRLAHGVRFCSPAMTLLYHVTSKMFVDDNTNYTNDFLRWLHCPPEQHQVITRTKHDAQTWERLLWTSGGLLKLTKCLYYIIYWNFDSEGRASMATPSQPTIQLTSGDSKQMDTIQQYNNSESHRTLGAWLNPHFDEARSIQDTIRYILTVFTTSPHQRNISMGSMDVIL